MARAYYNEIDPFSAAWLRELINGGHIARGDVDERSIVDVRPSDLEGYTQCHFFAGIGVWSYALRRAGWPDDKPIWTGSCPCQPFSAAGKGSGFDDERHLWPAFHWLIEQRRPSIIFGEQVASKDADPWVDLVQDDLEAMGYAFGAVPFPSAGIGAPHIRDRLYWLAAGQGVGLADAYDTGLEGRQGRRGCSVERVARSGRVVGGLADSECRRSPSGTVGPSASEANFVTENGGLRGLADGESGGCSSGAGLCDPRSSGERRVVAPNGDCDGGVADAQGIGERADQPRRDRRTGIELVGTEPRGHGCHDGSDAEQESKPGPTNGLWRDADWLFCRDGKWRPVGSKPQSLVDGSAESLGRVRDAHSRQIKEEIDAWQVESKIDGTQGLRDLLIAYGAEAPSKWEAGRIPGLCEAPFLLAFLRQLSEQGWREPERLPVSCEEVGEAVMRSLWRDEGIAGAPRQYGLEGQSAREYSDALLVLSSLLARGAREAWGVAYDAYAEAQHPLTSKARNRVGRLRGYGNAINAEAAVAFIEAFMKEEQCQP